MFLALVWPLFDSTLTESGQRWERHIVKEPRTEFKLEVCDNPTSKYRTNIADADIDTDTDTFLLFVISSV